MFVGSRRMGFRSYHDVDLESNSRAWWIEQSLARWYKCRRSRLELASPAERADPPILVLASIVPQKSRFRPGPASRLLQPRSENPGSFPSRAAQDRHETPSASERAARATEQNISARLRLPRRSAGSS